MVSFEQWADSCEWNTPAIGWTNFSSYSNGPDQRGIYCDGSRTPFDGDHYMGLYGCAGSAITMEGAEQQITGLTIGDYYTVSFYAIAGDSIYYAVDLSVYAYLDSVMVFESAPILKTDTWQQFQFSFQATDTIVDLALMTTDWGNYCSLATIGLDLVTINKGVGLSDEQSIEFILYPNPASDQLFIKTSKNIESPVQIVDVSGNVVFESTVLDKQIDVSILESGLYFLRLKNLPSTSQRFVKH
jgi:hypothetical protein